MKKVILGILMIVIICFLIPIFLTNEKIPVSAKIENVQNVIETNEEKNNINKYDYSKYNTVKLLHASTNEIEEINLDEYLLGVVSAEMPADFELEALKAQAVVARTYTMYKIANNNKKHGEADICDNSACCQAWISKDDRFNRWDEDKREANWGKITEAVYSTAGQIITYNGEPINAFFHSNSGGTTEMPINVWGGSGYPYLQVVQTSGEENYSQYSSEVEISREEIINEIKEKHSEIQIDWNSEKAIQILEYTDSGRVKTIKFGNVNLSGVETRTTFGLKSTNFSVELKENSVKFQVKGYGHGVGLSQTGSDSLAKEGKNYKEIIEHFYQGIEIINY